MTPAQSDLLKSILVAADPTVIPFEPQVLVSESAEPPALSPEFQRAIEQMIEKFGPVGGQPMGLPRRSTEDDYEEAKRLFSAKPAELADWFDAAHDLLLTEGWIQKSMRTPEGRCAMGAVCDALPFVQNKGNRTRFSVVRDQMFEVLGAELKAKRRSSGIADWNDTEGRTIDDVLDAFRRCAKTLRNQESE